MPLSIHFREARLSAMTLARVGNPLRSESLRTSRALCRFEDSEAELLTHCFLKCFRALELHQLHHHTDLKKNELFGDASAIFDDNEKLLERGAAIARHLHSKSNHPNIKSGDLCIALIDGIAAGGESVQALSIVKSETTVPFLQISERDGDLRLTTEQGIYPEKIDKGCLIVNHDRAHGFSIYLFDKSGSGGTHFWNRDFVGALPVKSDDYLTKHYSKLCVAFAEKGLPEETMQEERLEVATKAIAYLEEAEEFDLGDFEQKTLATPERIEQFEAFKNEYEEEGGHALEDKFTVSKKEAKKARARLKSSLKLDVGVDIRFSSGFISQSEKFLERGFDEERGMEFVKLWYYSEV